MLKKLGMFFVVFCILVIPSFVFGAEEEVGSIKLAINTIWVLIAAFLVFFMQAGFAMVETGLTRAKNASNIIMKNLMDFCIGSIVFFIVGYAFMFGDDIGGLIGISGFFGMDSIDRGVPTEAFIIFQTVFAATAATIVSGAMAERTKFVSYIIYSAVITTIIYPIVGHWIWGGGWLAQKGFIDFAGSTVVHSTGGWAALMGAYIIGPRIGKYSKDGKANAIPGHSITLAALGVFILWFGWFGFNPGSTLSGMDMSIARIAMTTILSAAAGAIIVMIITWIRYGKADVSMTLNGALAGLVGITAGCASVSMAGSIFIGIICGVLVVYGIEFVDKKLRIDDPVGAVGVHGISGAAGTILVGIFATEGGLLYGGGWNQFIVQLQGVGAVALWVICTSFILFKVIKATVGLRVEKEYEEGGLDINEHGTQAYADFHVKSAESLFF